MQILERFQQDIHSAANWSAQEAALLRAILHFGYDRYLFEMIPSIERNALNDYICVSNTSERWQKEYLDRGHLNVDNAVRHCLEHDSPALWSELHASAAPGKEMEVIELASDYGYTVGVTIPLWLQWNPFRFGLSLIVEGSVDFSSHDENFLKNRAELLAISRVFLSYADIREVILKKYGLKNDQVEVFRRLIKGQSRNEISIDLGFRLSKVKYYIADAAKKLNVDTNEQALAKFVMLGIVKFE